MGGNAQATLVQFLPLVILIAVMYFLMIRPQRKKDKAINEMRRSLTVGDEIVTIGGIVGKIVKTKDETIVIQVGADKIKMEMMRWAVSSVTKEAHGKAREVYEEVKISNPNRMITFIINGKAYELTLIEKRAPK